MIYKQQVPIEGWMSADELQWLNEKASVMNTILEIGSWKGRSTKALLEGCSGIVYAVDHFKGNSDQNNENGPHAEARTTSIKDQFLANVGHYKNLILIDKASTDAVLEFKDESIEMIFIDGGHAYDDILTDLRIWKPKCTKLLCGHDRDENGVPKALKDFDIEIEHGPGSIWFVNL